MIEFKHGNSKKTWLVPAEELTKGCTKKILVKCDVCGKIKTTNNQSYQKSVANQGYYACCQKCARKKVEATNLVKYGGVAPQCNKEISDKAKQTFINNYGVDNPFKSPLIQEKIKNTMIERYGVEHPIQSKEIKEKTIQTNIQRYGCEYHMQNPEQKAKFLENYSKNGVPHSSQENELKIILLEQNYTYKESLALDRCILDFVIYLNGVYINVECDGYFWHCKKKEDKYYDIRRDEFVLNKYDKVLRIVYNRTLPSKEEILKNIEELSLSDNNFMRIWSPDITKEQIEYFNNL